jgi:hypothetical protein
MAAPSGWVFMHLEPMREYIASNPQVFASLIQTVGSLVVGALTLFGVGLTLKHSRLKANRDREDAAESAQKAREFDMAQAAQERAHAQDEATKARVTEMRKGLYLEIATQYHDFVRMLARLPQMSPEEMSASYEAARGLTISASKTWLLSEVETSLSAREAHAQLNELYFQLVERTVGIKKIVYERDASVSQRKDLLAAVDEATTQMTADPVNREGYRRAVTEISLRARNVGDHIAGLEAQLQTLATEYRTALFAGLKTAMGESMEFMFRARLELGVGGEPEKMRLQNQQMFERAMASMQRLMDTIAH